MLCSDLSVFRFFDARPQSRFGFLARAFHPGEFFLNSGLSLFLRFLVDCRLLCFGVLVHLLNDFRVVAANLIDLRLSIGLCRFRLLYAGLHSGQCDLIGAFGLRELLIGSSSRRPTRLLACAGDLRRDSGGRFPPCLLHGFRLLASELFGEP